MIAIVTGDIINSEKHQVSEWMSILKKHLTKFGNSPQDWEVYRGDEFQLKIEDEKALRVAIVLKAKIKTIKGLDVRMGIGIGEESFKGASVSESNGSAYQLSGRIFEIADLLGIQQSAVSQRQKRARLELVQQVLTYYSTIINTL